MDRTFQVDLRGVVDLLSHHLYSSPRVYLRELLQNAVDAVTARRAAEGPGEAGEPAPIDIVVEGRTLTITDSGIGLTEAQVHELLATIGRSSKRDELGFARHEFLGQFGIGLLSAFLVADEVRVVTRAAGAEAVEWLGRSDGTYRIGPAERDGVGTTVALTARPGSEQWFAGPTVVELARLYGSMLPFPVVVRGELITGDGPPWRRDDGAPGNRRDDGTTGDERDSRTAGQRRAELVGYAQDTLGFTPFDVVELSVPEAGLTGVAYVLAFPTNPAAQAGHRVYLKRMLLTESAERLLPPWAFFARCVVDTAELRPTASRESLYDDGLLEATREALGEQLRGWLVGLAGTDPARLARFLDIHHLGVKALALHDDEMLGLVEQWMPLETNVGRMTLAEFRSRHGCVRYTTTIDDFRQLAAVASAHGLAVVNGGYTYDAEIVARLPDLHPELTVQRLEPTDVMIRLAQLDPALELSLRPFLTTAQRVMDRLGCEVVLRTFEPASLSVLYLLDRSAAFQAELRSTKAGVDQLWTGVLAAFEKPEPLRPQLVLNHRNPLVRRICSMTESGLVGLAVEALYGQALLLGHHPIRPADAALLNRSFLGLLDQAVPAEEDL